MSNVNTGMSLRNQTESNQTARNFFCFHFLLFSNKSSRGATLIVAGGNPRPPALYDSPVNIQLFRERLSERMHAIAKDIVGGNFECCTVPQMIPRPQMISKMDH